MDGWCVGDCDSRCLSLHHEECKAVQRVSDSAAVHEELQDRDGSNPEGPFLPLPYNMEWEVAEHHVLVSEVRAEGDAKEVL